MSSPTDTLYAQLPAYIRLRDGDTDDTLEQLLSIVERQAALIADDLEQMYDDCFIETCADWIVPYIADLLGYELPPGTAGTGLVRALAPRREVGNLLGHRRRKGTVVLLEELARDLGGWPGVAVEAYQRLVVAAHLDHVHLRRLGTADVRGRRGVEGPGTAFDRSCRIVDVRRVTAAESRGLDNIPNVGLYIYRMRRYPVTSTAANCCEDAGLNCYTFSVLGNDAPLYRLPDPPPAEWQSTTSDELPRPIGRFELELHADGNGASASADPNLAGPGRSFLVTVPDWPKRGAGGIIDAAALLPADLSGWSYVVPKNRIAVDPVLGRIMFPANQPPRKGVVVSYGYGYAMDIGGGEYERTLPPLPAAFSQARVHAGDAPPVAPGEYASVADAVDAWQKRRAAAAAGGAGTAPAPDALAALVVELLESGLYRGRLNLTLGAGESVWIIARVGTRPVLWLADDSAGGPDAISVRGAAGSRFVLDGVMVAGRGIDIGPLSVDGAEAARTPPDDVCQVLIRHATLVPGWGLHHDCEPLRPAEPSLLLDGSQACLRIEHSIVGAIQVVAANADQEVSPVCIEDSIIDATSSTRAALGAPDARLAPVALTLRRTTIVGKMLVHSITLAENSLLIGTVSVARRQEGCVRYCYVMPGSRTPRRYRCQPDLAVAAVDTIIADAMAANPKTPVPTASQRAAREAEAAMRVTPVFEALRYGTPGYLRLSTSTREAIRSGADDQGELGVFHDLYEPQRLAMLGTRLVDYVPAGMDAAVLLGS